VARRRTCRWSAGLYLEVDGRRPPWRCPIGGPEVGGLPRGRRTRGGGMFNPPWKQQFNSCLVEIGGEDRGDPGRQQSGGQRATLVTGAGGRGGVPRSLNEGRGWTVERAKSLPCDCFTSVGGYCHFGLATEGGTWRGLSA
jgi:hypothetical protein